jgi:ATP-dependent RNA helicase SUPV3L1/SUV3
LKPAARALASLLWAEKQDNVDMSALSNVQHLASSGRTSFPVDKALPRDAYRVLGYKQCGERAVRVDILERLADLIRPALAWRENSPGEKPSGAFDGRGFVVTQAMTSLTGSAGEDFASILRALGYRMDRRPPLPPKPAPVEVVETVAAETPPVEASAETTAETPVEDVAAELPVSGDPAPSAALLPEVSLVPAAEEPPPAAEAPPEPPQPEPEAAEAQAEPAAEVSAEAAPQAQPVVEATAEAAISAEAGTADAAPGSEAASADATAAPETPATPELVEVWRPGGRADERRPRHDRNRHRHHGRQDGAQPAAAASEAGEGAQREHHRRGRRHQDFRKPREGAPAEAVAAPAEGAPAREDRGPRRERFEGKGRDRDGGRREKFSGKGDRNERDRGGRDFKGGRDKGGRDKGGRDSGPSHRQYASSAPRERDRPIDPNSPFAKLAALKEQLASRKE